MNMKTKRADDHLMRRGNITKIRGLKQKAGVSWRELGEMVGDEFNWTTAFSPSRGESAWFPVSVLTGLAQCFGVSLESIADGGAVKTLTEVKSLAGKWSRAKANLACGRQSPRRLVVESMELRAKPDDLGEAIDDIRSGADVLARHLASQETAAERYRELVGVFSQQGLTHQEAVTKLRQLVHDASRFQQMRGLLA